MFPKGKISSKGASGFRGWRIYYLVETKERFIKFVYFLINMTSNLMQRLRTCSTEERRTVAIELVHIGTDDAIEALIQMADGVKNYIPGSWRNLWRDKPTEFYELEDQLIAIDTLGETGSKRALKYLNKIMDSRYISDRKSDSIFQSDGALLECWEKGVVDFSRAKSKLREALKSPYYDGEGITAYGHSDEKTNPIYQRLEAAVRKLQSNL